MEKAGEPDLHDAWGTELRIEPVSWYRDREFKYYSVISAGADQRFGTSDDMSEYIQVQTRNLASLPDSGNATLNIEHNRGPFNGLAEVAGTITDPSGAVVSRANIGLVEVKSGKSRRAMSDANGQFRLPGLPAGAYKIRIGMPGFRSALQSVTLQPRDGTGFGERRPAPNFRPNGESRGTRSS